MTEYYETSQLYSLAVTGLSKTETFKEAITEADSLSEVLDYYTEYFGDEEAARTEFYKSLNEALSNAPILFDYAQSVYINESNQYVVVDKNGIESIYDLEDVTNLKFMEYFDLDKYTEEFIENFENTMGKSIDDLVDEYALCQLETFGSGNLFQKLSAKDRANAVMLGFIHGFLNVEILNDINSKFINQIKNIS